MRLPQVKCCRNPTARAVTPLSLAVILIALAGCRDFSFLSELGETPRELELAPRTASLTPGQSLTFTVTGGMLPCTYTVLRGGGGTIDPQSGRYTAVLPGTDTVEVTDRQGATRQAAVSISAGDGLIVFPPLATVAPSQSLLLLPSGGTPGYTCTLTTNLSGGSVAADGTYTAGSISGVSDVVTVWDSASGAFEVAITVVESATGAHYVAFDFSLPAGASGGTAVAAGSLFELTNSGTADGAQDVRWAVYRSTDAILDSGDAILCSGLHPALPAGGSADVGLAGVWPMQAGTWYLIAVLSAADDLGPGNHWFVSSGTVAVSAAVKYQVVEPVPTPASAPRPGGAVDGTFQYTNIGSHAGTAALGWSVFASMNESLDASDVYIASGTAAGLAAGATSAAIPFSGTWPLTYGQYHLLVKITAADDLGTTDILAPTAIGLYDETPFIEPNSEVDLAPCIDLGVALKPGMRLRIDGSMDATDAHDIFGFDTGSAGFVTVSVHWTGAPGDARMFAMNGPLSFFIGVSMVDTTYLTYYWPVDSADADRWIDFENWANPLRADFGTYTMIISAD